MEFRSKYIRDPNKVIGHVVEVCRSDGLVKYRESSEVDAKNFEIFHTMFAGKDISEVEMKTIEGIAMTYEFGYVTKKIQAREDEYQKQYHTIHNIDEKLEGQRLKRKVSEIEANLPSEEIESEVEPVPLIISPKGNGK